MYSCLGIAWNTFPVRAHGINKLSIKTIFAKTTSPLRTIPPIQHFATFQDRFLFHFNFHPQKQLYCGSVSTVGGFDVWFEFFDRSWEHPPADLYSNIKDTPNFCENSQVWSSPFPYFKWCFKYLLTVHNSRLNV